MKKKLLLFPIIGLLLSGCSFEDIMFWKKKDSDNQQNDNSDPADPSQDPTNTDPVPVSKIILSEHNLEIEELEQHTLSFTVEPANATYKTIEWSVGNGLVANIADGVVTGINEGTTSVTVTVDNAKSDSCTVKVNKKVPQVKTITSSVIFTDLYESLTGDTISPYTNLDSIDENITYQFAKTEESDTISAPICKKYNHVWSARMYPNNTLTITSSEATIREIEFTFASTNNSGNQSTTPIASDPTGFSNTKWNGSATQVVFTTTGSAYRCISCIKVTYEGEHDPDDPINLGVKTISEIREYISEHPKTPDAFGNWINDKVTVTFTGLAIAKIDMVKTSKEYGDNISKPGKVIMADSTGYIGAASSVKLDTELWEKVDKYQCSPTSKYIVTGHISYYRGNPEVYVTSCTYDTKLNVTWNPAALSSGVITLTQFYENACNVDYNCGGHGYGQIYRLEGVRCHEYNSNGQHLDMYKVTDGTKNLNVNAYNISTKMSAGSIYNITGIISLKNYSPIIIAFSIEKVEGVAPAFDYASIATETTLANLRTISGDQDDTMTRYPNLVNNFGIIYKTTGYINAITENGLYYVGISDQKVSKTDIDGKDNASTTYKLTLIHNKNYWAAEASEVQRYNDMYKQGYVWGDDPIDIYYVVHQIRYVSHQPIWEIYLLNDFLTDLALQAA